MQGYQDYCGQLGNILSTPVEPHALGSAEYMNIRARQGFETRSTLQAWANKANPHLHSIQWHVIDTAAGPQLRDEPHV